MESARRLVVSLAALFYFAGRRILLCCTSGLINRRFAFAISTVAILGAKAVHIVAHHDALPTSDLLAWGISFFAQDTVLLLFLRLLVDRHARQVRWLAALLTALVLVLASVSISFFAVAGSELQWRNMALAGDSGSWKMMMTGLFPTLLAAAALLALAVVLQAPCYAVGGIALDTLTRPTKPLVCQSSGRYVPLDDNGDGLELDFTGEKPWDDTDDADLLRDPRLPLKDPRLPTLTVMPKVLAGVLLLAQIIATILRPADSSLVYMSWTLPMMPLVSFAFSSPTLHRLLVYSSSASPSLDNRTALAQPIAWPWLPNDTLAGFQDWYDAGKVHYSAAADPLKLSNLDDNLLPALRNGTLTDMTIRNVMLIKLESTRKDVFPFKKDGVVWERLESTFQNKSLPEGARKMLASLTPTANCLTGDYNDGFTNGSVNIASQSQGTCRGGINANNAYTTSTYTFKSLIGTLCGIAPLMADFNVEHAHHIYQPCLAHIFEAFGQLDHTNDPKEIKHNFTSFKWKSSFMQSVTDTYDKQDLLMPALGYPKEHHQNIEKGYLKGSPKFGPVNLTDNNYYGMPEVAVEDYIRDAFAGAKRRNERVFLTHITSTTHHAFGLPEGEPYVQLTDDKKWNDLSLYLNAVGYVDRWLRKILDVLESEGVADETLLIIAGDHGLSIAERGTVTPYSNPHVANYHVPLVISHPKLPKLNIDDAVTSRQILPTVLDLLLETGSLSDSESVAARDLVRNYEGQSLLRPLRKFSEKTGQGDWQFTVMNPGGSTLAVRDARQPNWRLIVPIFGNYEWRFTDLAADPHERNPALSFELSKLQTILRRHHRSEVAEWVEEAAVVARWWVDENHKRWRYDPS
ncbi:hypothetical protein G6O67_007843 [Ophiocordyceps sinensis]|uniref:Sulfatase N-terminal domain-containing protein n=1 Tax=Ophiocordyceps sinensis TaxID=72228 RepID=A0A8H4LUZ0_9HYPO|nr:hypothetical protein G6O67_007843 [Ophiocordyceps sinensis]